MAHWSEVYTCQNRNEIWEFLITYSIGTNFRDEREKWYTFSINPTRPNSLQCSRLEIRRPANFTQFRNLEAFKFWKIWSASTSLLRCMTWGINSISLPQHARSFYEDSQCVSDRDKESFCQDIYCHWYFIETNIILQRGSIYSLSLCGPQSPILLFLNYCARFTGTSEVWKDLLGVIFIFSITARMFLSEWKKCNW